MKQSLRRSAAFLAVLILVSTTAFAEVHMIQLVQGKRMVRDSVLFTIEVAHSRDENPRYTKAPEFIQIQVQLSENASGLVSIDGRAIGRFDETRYFISNPTDVTYGRHVVTLRIEGAAALTGFTVRVPGAALREVMEETSTESSSTPQPPDDRIVQLELRVKQLEAEVDALKKSRRVQ